MGFKKVVQPPKSTCFCQKPDSKQGKFFGSGTIWVCDLCGSAWEFMGYKHDYRDGYDNWQRSPGNNGPDNRPSPLSPTARYCDEPWRGR